MARILYFASLAETLGSRSEQLELPAECRTATDLVALLRARGEPFDSTFGGDTRVLVAINQEVTNAGGRVVLCNLERRPLSVLYTTKLYDVFEVKKTLREALDLFETVVS